MDEQIYYHYLSFEDAMDDLKKKRIRVSTLNGLNDPFEWMPYKGYGFRKRQLYNRVFRRMLKKWGLLCFSRSWEEQLLWAYYARGHKGMALGFEIPEDKIIEVDYTSDEKRTKFELTNEIDDEKKFLELAKKKYQEWEHEKEYRILVNLEKGDLDEDEDDGCYYMPLRDRLKIKEIVLGCRAKNTGKEEDIVKFAKKLNADIRQVRTEWVGYKMHRCGTGTDYFQNMLKK